LNPGSQCSERLLRHCDWQKILTFNIKLILVFCPFTSPIYDFIVDEADILVGVPQRHICAELLDASDKRSQTDRH
jgi:hypothetical protein